MNRAELQKLAELRNQEAHILLAAASYPGAFYLAGYAIECALKSCIAKQTKEYDFPDKDEVNKSYTHNLEVLVGLAKLKDKLDNDMKANKQLEAYWACVVDWEEGQRYELGITEKEAKDLCEAVADPANGVLQWLRKCW
jgi:HEPN domain-containing protein